MTTRHVPRPILAALVAVLLVAPHAAATITPEAQKVVERFLEVTGGRETFLAERSMRTKNSLEAFGLKGTAETWNVRPDKSASLTALGPLKIREGFDGKTAWRIDQNGKFSLRDGKDLEEAKASGYFNNDQWLMADQGGGDVTVKGSEKDSTGTYTVVTVRPPIGRPHDFWFDQKTGLLSRSIVVTDRGTVVTRSSDYQKFAGRLRPRATLISVQGMPANDARAILDSVWVNLAIDASVFAPADQAVADVRFLLNPAHARLPFHYGERHVWLKASINGGPPEDFLLDTGASVTVIDSAAAVRHGLKVEGRMQAHGAGAAGGASFSEVDSIRVVAQDGNGVVVAQQKVAVLSLNPYLEPFFWRPIAGVLGYDFISRFVLEVDFDREMLVLHYPPTFRYSGGGTAIPLTLAGNIPVVKAKLDGQYEGQFRLDVGSGSTVDVHGPFAKQHQLQNQLGKTIEVTGGGFGGTFQSVLGRMKKMEIGPYSWEMPIVSVSGAETGGLASQDYAGNIGNQILDRFKCTFDYERRVVYLEPGQRYGKRDRFSMAGLQVAKTPDGYRAMQIVPGSAAAEAGLLTLDRVVTVNGKPIESYTADQLGRIFDGGQPGEKHVVEIVRDGKKRKLSLKLKEIV
ncbi:MAG TPA: aspartyl protease family protein [Candidatus Limnocylindria bacterium]|nr:aspartyl protease family protein [Candidatus Limnocylindria bacterium]